MHLFGVKLAISFSYSLHFSYFFKKCKSFLVIYLSIFNGMLVFLNILITILVSCISLFYFIFSKFAYQNSHYFRVILNVFQGIFPLVSMFFSGIESRRNLGSSKTIYFFVLITCIWIYIHIYLCVYNIHICCTYRCVVCIISYLIKG